MICRKCGTRLAEDSLFCDQCGQGVVDTPTGGSASPSEPIRPVTWSPPPPPIGETTRLPAYTPPPASEPRRRGGLPLGIVGLLLVGLVGAGAWAINGGLPGLTQPTATAKAGLVTTAGPTSALSSATPVAARATITPTPAAIAARPTGSPTALAARPTSTLAAVASTPTRAALPTQAPPTATARPAGIAPTVAPILPGLARILGKTGLSVEGPAGWTYVEDLGSSQEGSFMFYAQKAEATKGFFTSSGLFAIQTWLMPEATEYSPEEILLGFVDGQVTEYASRFGGDPRVSDYTISAMKNARFAGWEATFEISGKGGTFLYAWADLRASGRFVEVICQGTQASWDATATACRGAYATIDLGD